MRQPATTTERSRLLQIIENAKTAPRDEIERRADEIENERAQRRAPASSPVPTDKATAYLE
jgi:hypothetical protein